MGKWLEGGGSNGRVGGGERSLWERPRQYGKVVWKVPNNNKILLLYNEG